MANWACMAFGVSTLTTSTRGSASSASKDGAASQPKSEQNFANRSGWGSVAATSGAPAAA